MVEIKEGYKDQFNVTLADDMKKNYTGNTSKILLALIKGTVRNRYPMLCGVQQWIFPQNYTTQILNTIFLFI